MLLAVAVAAAGAGARSSERQRKGVLPRKTFFNELHGTVPNDMSKHFANVKVHYRGLLLLAEYTKRGENSPCPKF